MKNYIIAGLLSLAISTTAQTKINKSIPVDKGQTIFMKFDYPELIRVSTWDKNEILIQGDVTINSGENDDAFELIASTAGNTVQIENQIKDMDNLPQMITVVDGSRKVIFKSKQEYKKFKSETDACCDVVSWGVDMEIFLDIKVPQSISTSMISVYGMVEVRNFQAPLQVEARYGGVDVALNAKAVGELTAETNYGQIYSNLDIKFENDGLRQKDFYTFVSAKPGSGPAYNFESKYGNVYLRKSN